MLRKLVCGEAMDNTVEQLTQQLGSFDPTERRQAMEALAALTRAGKIELLPRKGWINLHCHTFFSYNAYGYSPSWFAWEAWRQGLDVAGIVDFDCLDGTHEFLEAGRLLGLKTTVGFETRVFIREYRHLVTNSPQEPGVSYLITTGFTEPPKPGTGAARTLTGMAARARSRNLVMLAKINDYLDPVRIDYERDVLPLTAAGNATERHMLEAYETAARRLFPHDDRLAEFWSRKLGEGKEAVRALLHNSPALRDLIRSRLMKHGGVGYAQPEEGSFPPLEEVIEMTLSCGAIPVAGWLDGTNDGEADPIELFEFFRSKGCAVANIIPDRNWNVPEPERALKVRKLHEAVAAAQKLDLPILVGTEMNKHGSKFVDGFDSEALAPHLEEFRRGAHIAWGHTLLKMTAGVGYVGEWAEAHFGDRLGEKNEFFRRIGAAPYPGAEVMQRCTEIGPEGEPAEFQDAIAGA